MKRLALTMLLLVSAAASAASTLSFVDYIRSVDKVDEDWQVTFKVHAAIYHAHDEKLALSLADSLKKGSAVKVSVDSGSLEISAVEPAPDPAK